MRSRTLLFTLSVLLALAIGAIWFYLSTNKQEDLRVFPAIVNRDCAPWDGSAFTVSIPYTSGTMIYISIWQSPDIKFPAAFTFPDETGRVGKATYLLRYSYYVQLSGKVFLTRVKQGIPVEGEFDLLTEAGQRLRGDFKAEWQEGPVYCG